MNLTLYPVKSNDLQLMNMPLWILEGALWMKSIREEWLSSSSSGDCSMWGKEEMKSKVPIGKIMLMAVNLALLSVTVCRSYQAFPPWNCTLHVFSFLCHNPPPPPKKKHLHTCTPSQQPRNLQFCLKSWSTWRRFFMPDSKSICN